MVPPNVLFLILALSAFNLDDHEVESRKVSWDVLPQPTPCTNCRDCSPCQELSPPPPQQLPDQPVSVAPPPPPLFPGYLSPPPPTPPRPEVNCSQVPPGCCQHPPPYPLGYQPPYSLVYQPPPYPGYQPVVENDCGCFSPNFSSISLLLLSIALLL